jgi:peptidyl-dipeptidase A
MSERRTCAMRLRFVEHQRSIWTNVWQSSMTSYFLAHILQFQFYKAMCDIAGHEGPVHRCSFYGSEEAGRRLNAMLEMGRKQPWPDALEALTGQREMDGTAVLEYFAPLKDWLDEQNADRQCGWSKS